MGERWDLSVGSYNDGKGKKERIGRIGGSEKRKEEPRFRSTAKERERVEGNNHRGDRRKNQRQRTEEDGGGSKARNESKERE